MSPETGSEKKAREIKRLLSMSMNGKIYAQITALKPIFFSRTSSTDSFILKAFPWSCSSISLDSDSAIPQADFELQPEQFISPFNLTVTVFPEIFETVPACLMLC